MKIAIYVNPISPFGRAFVESAIDHCRLDINMIVFPTLSLWWEFRCRLKGEKLVEASSAYEEYFNNEVLVTSKWLRKKNNNLIVRSVDSANTSIEANLVKSCDLVFSAAFPQIFTETFFLAPKFPAINFHPSYLPRCQGAHPVYWTIAEQEEYGGVSSHYITNEIDRGPIIHRMKVLFNKDTVTYKLLYTKIIKALPEAIKHCLINIEANKLAENISEVATYYREDKLKDHKLNLTMNVSAASAKIRAGKAFIYHDSYRLHLFPPVTIQVEKEKKNTKNLSYVDDERIMINFMDGSLLTKISLEGTMLKRILSKGKRMHLPFFSYFLDIYYRWIISKVTNSSHKH